MARRRKREALAASAQNRHPSYPSLGEFGHNSPRQRRWAKFGPDGDLLKVFRFLTSKPRVQRRIGLLATWRTSEDCVEAKKMKSSLWSSVPDISARFSFP
ncbi:hypothetical protein U9M48_043564 [Paspalum notatum var. saurae]|uniref:Uncharacterized protein n=1 Tax=Paspalum notatum var. saurae TaxID=547442 RepID=A0AAQ3UT90_PASNO